MAEFENTLNSLLSNPEAMEQIMSLAKSLGGEGGVSFDSSPPSDPLEGPHAQATPPDSSIGDLLSGFADGLDPSMIQMMGKLMQETGNQKQDDRNMALISALRPFLKEKRQSKIEQAMQLAKFSRLARVAFQMMKGGEDAV